MWLDGIVRALDLRFDSPYPRRRAAVPGSVVHSRSSVNEQYNLVPAEVR